MTPMFSIRSEDGLNKQIQDTSCNFCIYNFAIRVIFYRENFCEKFSFWEFIFADRGTKNKIAKKKTSKNFPATRNFEMEVVPATKEVRTHCEPM